MVRRSAQAQRTWARSHSRGIRRCRSCYDRETTAVLSTMAQKRKELPKITDFFSATSGNVCESAERGVGPAPVKQSEHRVRAGSPTHTYFTRMSTRNTGEACLGSEDPRCIHFLGHTPPPPPPPPPTVAWLLYPLPPHITPPPCLKLGNTALTQPSYRHKHYVTTEAICCCLQTCKSLLNVLVGTPL